MTFWIVGLITLAIVLVAAVWLLEAWDDRRPSKVSASDWDRISHEKDDEFTRRRTLGHATHSRTAAHTRVIR